MKSHVADYATRVYCVRIVPANDSAIVRLAGYPVDLVMSNGEVYKTESGYEFSGISSSGDLTAGTIDLSGILQDGAISRQKLDSGVYDNARVYLFATSWTAPVEDEEPISCMFFGKATVTDDSYKVQLMGMIDALNQSGGQSYSATCPWVFLDKTLDEREIPYSASKCTGPRLAPDGPDFDVLKVVGTLTSVASQYEFRDSARSEAADYFGAGSLRFVTGNNAGLRPIEIKSYASDGTIVLQDALPYLPITGDQYEMIPGCRKRHIEDCKTKWSNVKNFGGHPHIPAPSVYSQVGRN